MRSRACAHFSAVENAGRGNLLPKPPLKVLFARIPARFPFTPFFLVAGKLLRLVFQCRLRANVPDLGPKTNFTLNALAAKCAFQNWTPPVTGGGLLFQFSMLCNGTVKWPSFFGIASCIALLELCSGHVSIVNAVVFGHFGNVAMQICNAVYFCIVHAFSLCSRFAADCNASIACQCKRRHFCAEECICCWYVHVLTQLHTPG